jgi:hypothetical protein
MQSARCYLLHRLVLEAGPSLFSEQVRSPGFLLLFPWAQEQEAGVTALLRSEEPQLGLPLDPGWLYGAAYDDYMAGGRLPAFEEAPELIVLACFRSRGSDRLRDELLPLAAQVREVLLPLAQCQVLDVTEWRSGPASAAGDSILGQLCCHVLGIAHRLGPQSWLYVLAHTPDTVAERMWPAMSSASSSAGFALLDVTRWYRHRRCGFVYAVGNCGNLNGTGICPQCRASIGAGSDSEPTGAPVFEQRGYCPQPLSAAPERSLSVSAYWLLRVIISCCLFYNVRAHEKRFVVTRKIFSVEFPGPDDERGTLDRYARYLIQQIRGDVKSWGEIFGATSESESVSLVHAALSLLAPHIRGAVTVGYEAPREQFEAQWSAAMAAARLHQVAVLKAALYTATRRVQHLESEAANCLAAVARGTDSGPVFLLESRVPTMASFLQYVKSALSDPTMAAAAGNLWRIWEFQQHLAALSNLHHVTQFCTKLRAVLGGQLTRKAAEQRSWSWLVSQVSSAERPGLYESLSGIVQLWNTVRGFIDQFECQQNVRIPELPVSRSDLDRTLLSLLLPAENEDIASIVFARAVELHNQVLRELSAACTQPLKGCIAHESCVKPLHLLAGAHEAIGDVRVLERRVVLSAIADGEGGFSWNLEALLDSVCRDMFAWRPLVSWDLHSGGFLYAQRPRAARWDAVHRVVPQQPGSDENLQVLRKFCGNVQPETLATTADALSACIGLFSLGLPRLDPMCTVAELAEQAALVTLTADGGRLLKQFKLCHLHWVFEELQEAAFPRAVDELSPARCKAPLPAGAFNASSKLLSRAPQALFSALRVLLVGGALPPPSDLSLWEALQLDLPSDLEPLPELLVCHAYELWKLLCLARGHGLPAASLQHHAQTVEPPLAISELTTAAQVLAAQDVEYQQSLAADLAKQNARRLEEERRVAEMQQAEGERRQLQQRAYAREAFRTLTAPEQIMLRVRDQAGTTHLIYVEPSREALHRFCELLDTTLSQRSYRVVRPGVGVADVVLDVVNGTAGVSSPYSLASYGGSLLQLENT